MGGQCRFGQLRATGEDPNGTCTHGLRIYDGEHEIAAAPPALHIAFARLSFDTREISILEHRPAAIDTDIRSSSHPASPPYCRGLLPQLRALSAGIASLDSEIAPRCRALIDYQLFAELPGAGPVFASRLLAAFGEQRDHFANGAAFQKYAGIAPVTEHSGNKHWVHWRHKAKGASHNATIRALAFKWISILFRCWVDRTPYDESRYLSALQKRHSPILKFAAQDPS